MSIVTSAPVDVLITLVSDIGLQGEFAPRTLEVTNEFLRTMEQDGTESLRIEIADILNARNEPLIGGGQMEITCKDGVVVPVIAYSLTLAPAFSECARGIEQLAAGTPLSIKISTKSLRCNKCGRLLPDKDGICPVCVNRNRTFFRIAGYLRPYTKQALTLVALSLCTTAVNLVPPVLQGHLIDAVFTKHQHIGILFQTIGVWAVVIVITALLQIAAGRTTAYLAGSIAADLRAAVFQAIELLQVSYFDKKQVGSITSRVTQDTDRVWGFLVDGLPYLASNSLLFLGITGMLLVTNWRLALAVMAPVPLMLVLSAISWGSISRLYFKVGQKWARFHMHLNEALTGIRVVKIFAREDAEMQKFRSRNGDLRTAGIEADTRWFTVFGAMTLLVASGQLINWIVGGEMVYGHQITLGQFVRVNSYIAMVYGPLQWFGDLNQWFSRAMAGAERIFEVIDAETEPYAKNDLHPAIVGRVIFDGVRFGYDKSNPVINGLSFVAEPGEMIGLVGKSGAGKSTTINLLCRFYEPDAGTITIDDVDYCEYELQALRRQVGVVLQDPFLFNGTIAENIAYARPEAGFMEIVAAARQANAHHFILAKTDGYDTLVGEKGAQLSGGERQRISIARAILHNPRILILDEATSAVDVETERQIQEALANLVKGRTTFAIAHRLSTLRNADRLIVLEKGRIVEIGTHNELLEKQGVFYNLVKTQSQVTQIMEVGD